MHRVLLVLVVCMAPLAAVPAAAPAHYGDAPADAAQKKSKKAKRCKRGRIRVKVGRRRTCRPLRKAFPKPKAGDPRKLFAGAVLTTDFSRLRNRRGRRLPSLPKLIRKAGRQAQALLARMTRRGFCRLDAMEASAAAARAGAGPAQSGGCGSLPRRSDSFTSRASDGSSATARAETAPTAPRSAST